MRFNPKKAFKIISVVLVLITILVSIQSFYLERKGVDHNDILYTQYNNYDIFTYSFHHLIENKNLYGDYEIEYYDLFKYSPTFALFMGLFAFLPTLLGLVLWNLLNALVLILAIKNLPLKESKKIVFILAFVLIEMITSIQSSQSNALMVGLLLWAFIYMEKKNLFIATLLITVTVFIKIFGVLAFSLFLFYPKKWKTMAYSLFWLLLLFGLPLIVVSFSELWQQYENWLIMLQKDQSKSLGFSVKGWLESWFGITGINNLILLVGSLALFLPLVKISQYKQFNFRFLFLSSLLIWMVIFNHKAESPTYIIAIMGVALWYFSQKTSVLNRILLGLTFVFTILSPTDLFPRVIREMWVNPYALKAVPVIVIWFKITYDLLRMDSSKT